MSSTGSPSDQPTPTDRPRSSARHDDEQADGDLLRALDGLSRVAVGEQTLEASLEWIAQLARTAIPGADGAGISMVEEGHRQTVCASADFVRAVDRVQYDVEEGPCVTAAAEAATIVSGRLTADPRWPRFSPRIRDLGVDSVVSLPMVMPNGEVMGALNVYARAAGAFDDDAARQGQVFATAAAVSVNNARALMQARRLAEQLKAALVSRATIDQAIGILMSRQGGSPEDGFAALRRLSQNQNVKLATVAQEIVREAVLRARARHGGAAGDS